MCDEIGLVAVERLDADPYSEPLRLADGPAHGLHRPCPFLGLGCERRQPGLPGREHLYQGGADLRREAQAVDDVAHGVGADGRVGMRQVPPRCGHRARGGESKRLEAVPRKQPPDLGGVEGSRFPRDLHPVESRRGDARQGRLQRRVAVDPDTDTKSWQGLLPRETAQPAADMSADWRRASRWAGRMHAAKTRMSSVDRAAPRPMVPYSAHERIRIVTRSCPGDIKKMT